MSEGVKQESRYTLDSEGIHAFLPHRLPFLLVDRILEIHPVGDTRSASLESKEGVRVVGIKNVSNNEPWVAGHFPGMPVYPGVMIVETMAQTAAFALYPYLSESTVKGASQSIQCVLAGVDNARFRRRVSPGDTLRIEAVVTKCRSKLWAFKCDVTCEGKRVAEAEVLINFSFPESAGVAGGKSA